jgi:glucosamine-phosphate N-acetyltransferase
MTLPTSGLGGERAKQPKIKTTIRELRLEDLDNGLLKTLDNLLAGTSELDADKAKALLHEIKSNPLHKVLVAALQSGEIVGVVTLLVESKFIFKGGRVGHIEDVSVRKGFEKMGIGRELVLHAMDLAKEMECVKLVLDCSDATMPFYTRMGFSYQDNCMKKFLRDLPQ